MIKIKDVSKVYENGKKALNKINLEVNKKDIVGIIGRNGAGKTTLFKIICGLIDDYTGESKVFDKMSDITLTDEISYLPEMRGLDHRAYVIEHLTDLVRYKGLSKKEALQSVTKWLKEFSLYDYKYQKISSLSKGNQQKIQLIASIASNPKILILDEPFSGLDLITIDLFWKTILKLRDEGCTILFSTHDLNDNILKCNKLVFINQGEIKESGTIEEIQKHFNMVLELKNKSCSIEYLQSIAGKENVQVVEGDEYYIKIKDEKMARVIFDGLQDKYSEKFFVRKIRVPEIFREICR